MQSDKSIMGRSSKQSGSLFKSAGITLVCLLVLYKGAQGLAREDHPIPGAQGTVEVAFLQGWEAGPSKWLGELPLSSPPPVATYL